MTTEANAAIAEFMGAKYYEAWECPVYHWHTPVYDFGMPENYPTKHASRCHEPRQLQYHTSWDWLMLVVDDIKYARRFPTVVWNDLSHPSNILYRKIEKAILNLSISQTHAAVEDFITWYNNQKQNS